MAISSTLKGMHNLKTIHTQKKESQSNYLKLYILDKERTRLRSEQIRLNLRLEIINARLKEIEEFNKFVVANENPETESQKPEPENKDGDKQWKTMEIDY
jgi:hypothetical protein